MSVIIGITGRAGTGKSTVSKYLSAQYGFKRYAFADPVKAMMRTMYEGIGLTWEEIDARLDGDLKEQPDVHLGYRSPRKAMQSLGTEWGRGLWGNLWTNHMMERLRRFTSGDRIVIDDVRMDNEAQLVVEHKAFDVNGLLWINPDGDPKRQPSGHASEKGLTRSMFPFMIEIKHDYTILRMQTLVDAAMVELGVEPVGIWR